MAGDDNASDSGDYIVTMRGTLKRAPVGSPHPESIFRTGSRRNGMDPQSIFRNGTVLNAGEIGGGVVIPEPTTDAYSPYAAKWKEFDKLQKQAKGSKFQWAHWLWGVIFPVFGLLNTRRVPKKDDVWLVGVAAGLAVVGLVQAQYAKQRFAHWPCPRCRAEWPGTKTEKELRCAVCGLKLHQLTP